MGWPEAGRRLARLRSAAWQAIIPLTGRRFSNRHALYPIAALPDARVPLPDHRLERIVGPDKVRDVVIVPLEGWRRG